jgi:hypothetical protein
MSTEVLQLTSGEHFGLAVFHLRCWWSNGDERTVRACVPILDQSEGLPYRRMEVELPKAGPLLVDAIPGSVAHDLSRLVEHLSWQFWWPFSQALLFVLTDEAPPSPAIHTATAKRSGPEFTQARITMEIQPWTPPEVVRRVYQHARRWVLGPNRARSVSESSLRLFDFSAERIDEAKREVARARSSQDANPADLTDSAAESIAERVAGGIVVDGDPGEHSRQGRPTWRLVADEWNARVGRTSRRNWRSLSKTYRETEERLMNPPLPMGDDVTVILAERRLHRALDRAKTTAERAKLVRDALRPEATSEERHAPPGPRSQPPVRRGTR